MVKDISGFFQRIHIMHSIPFGNRIPKAFILSSGKSTGRYVKRAREVGQKIEKNLLDGRTNQPHLRGSASSRMRWGIDARASGPRDRKSRWTRFQRQRVNRSASNTMAGQEVRRSEENILLIGFATRPVSRE